MTQVEGVLEALQRLAIAEFGDEIRKEAAELAARTIADIEDLANPVDESGL